MVAFEFSRLYMNPHDVVSKETWTHVFIRFCAELMELLQSSLGGQRMFEHPRGSVAWPNASMQKLMDRTHQVHVDMRRYGLCVPGGPLIR